MPDKTVKTTTAKSKVSAESSGTVGVGVTFGVWVRAKFWVAEGKKSITVVKVTFLLVVK
jgi:hypothetical protein